MGASFNGATTKASWKADRCRHGRLAWTRLQWGHDEGVVEGPSAAVSVVPHAMGFNGATTKASWKAVAQSAVDDVPCVASMGPRRRRRGRQERPSSVKSTWPSFNGATTKASWKATARARDWLMSSLQWGHDEGVVEGVKAQTGLAS